MLQALRHGETNQLLANLAPDDAKYIARLSHLEHPPQGRILTSAAEPGTDLWFPRAGTVALMTTDASGRSVQTGIIGREGCVGLRLLFDNASPVPDAVVQITGAMSVMSVTDLRTALEMRPSIELALSAFLYGMSARSTQTIACNRLHSLLSRCCRWLLTLQDEAQSNDLALTQDSLATLLGSGRPRVNLALATLEANGILSRHRGRIRLLARDRLKRHSCDCYRINSMPSIADS